MIKLTLVVLAMLAVGLPAPVMAMRAPPQPILCDGGDYVGNDHQRVADGGDYVGNDRQQVADCGGSCATATLT